MNRLDRIEERFLVEALERRTGRRFSDPGLLLVAATHASYANANGCEDYERLETLGDAVLSFLAADELYRRMPDAGPGELTDARSHVVAGPTLTAVANDLDLAGLIRIAPEAETAVRGNAAVLEDAVEALIGALHLDGGIGAAGRFFLERFAGALDAAANGRETVNWKSRLQDFSQREYGIPPDYRIESESGPPHRREFAVVVRVNGEPVGTGRGPSKKTAEREAARAACTGLIG